MKVSHGRMQEDEARKYFQQLIHVVDYCHSRGVFHRDLKVIEVAFQIFHEYSILLAKSQKLYFMLDSVSFPCSRKTYSWMLPETLKFPTSG